MILRSSFSKGVRKVYTEIENSLSSDDFENGGSGTSDDYSSPEEAKEDGEGEMSRGTTSTGIVEETCEGKRKSKKNKPLLEWQLVVQQTRTWIAENADKDTDLMNLNETLSEILEPTDDLIIPLLRFQKEWLAWAVKQEESSYKGGILADEMGMGKTLQAIALVLFKRRNPSHEQNLQLINGTVLFKCTLVLCPQIAVKQWVQEIERSTLRGSVNVLVYHGQNRKLRHLNEYDFVITTYDVVTKEHSMSLKTTQDSESGLHSVMWDRIILDEAHYMKGLRNKRNKAVFALQSIYKWALSGTPVQNCFGDFYSVVCFLRVRPYSFSFCKKCNCSCIERRFKECPNCGHHKYVHTHWWVKYVTSPMQMGKTKDLSNKQAMILIKHNIMKNIMLRRTKVGRPADLALPPKIFVVIQETLRLDSLDKAEQEYYETLPERIPNRIYLSVNRETLMQQAVNHPYLVEYSWNEATWAILRRQDLNPIVIDYVEDFKEWKSKGSSILDIIKLDQFKTSSKIEALREEIRFMAEMDGSAKGIVFSQFPPFLDLISYALHKSGVNSVIFYGTEVARDAAITRFREDPNCRMFLTTFKVGGIVLNLTVASHVFLMEPWYTPTVDWQAQDRVHRVGQRKPVRVVRFIMKNTVEETILEKRKNKEILIEGTVVGSSEGMDKLGTLKGWDLWPLFRD